MDSVIGPLFAFLALLIIVVGLGALALAVTEAPLASLPFADALRRRTRRSPAVPAVIPAIAAETGNGSPVAVAVNGTTEEPDRVEETVPPPDAVVGDREVSDATTADVISEASAGAAGETPVSEVSESESQAEPDQAVEGTTPVDVAEAGDDEAIEVAAAAATSGASVETNGEISVTEAPPTDLPSAAGRASSD